MFDGVFYEVKSQLTAPRASVEEVLSCICSTGLSYTLSALIISRNVTLVQDKSAPLDKPASTVGSTVRDTVCAHNLQLCESVF